LGQARQKGERHPCFSCSFLRSEVQANAQKVLVRKKNGVVLPIPIFTWCMDTDKPGKAFFFS